MMTTTEPSVSPDGARPVAPTERINSIDMLRGIAVVGILVMNIYGFAMPFAAYMNPLAHGGTEWYNVGTWFFTHILFDQKFLPIFSMLYGAGLVLMIDRAAARGAKIGGIWYRRNFWLLVIGALHAYLIWFGDILFFYAFIGMLIYPLRNRSPRALIIIACVMFLIGILLSLGGGTQMAKLRTAATEVSELQAAGETLSEEQQETLAQWEEMLPFVGPPGPVVEKDLAGYAQGYTDVVAFRAPQVAMMHVQALPFFLIWRVGGLMLIGMALMKLGVFSAVRSTAFYKRLMLFGYVTGLPLVLLSAWILQANDWDPLFTFKVGGLPNYVGSILMSLGHVSLFLLIIKSGALTRLLARFAALGRMALTNYLMHSVVMTSIFYGYGLGLYGDVPRLYQMSFVVAMVAFQLWFSPVWLASFRFGPVEWLWRSLTYWRMQPLRKAAA